MKQKIKWYQEVLELEPTSRVFFPLAKMHIEDNNFSEAITVLAHGLRFDSTNIEARLLLVDLLLQGNKTKELWAEVDKIGKLLIDYPAFLTAWAQRLTHIPSLKDAALALNFFVSSLQTGKFSWSEVIYKGMEEILSAQREAFQALRSPKVKVKAPESDQACTSKEALDLPPSPASHKLAKSLAIQVVTTANNEEQEFYVTPNNEEQEFYVTPSNGNNNFEEQERLILQANTGLSFETELDLDAPSPNIKDLMAEAAKENTAISQPAKVAQAKAIAKAQICVDDSFEEDADFEGEINLETTENQLSLKTRTMAEVLADQGDFVGALDIYESLIQESTNESEKQLLQNDIAKLNERISQIAAQATPVIAKPGDFSSGSNRIVEILEALAERLDNRS